MLIKNMAISRAVVPDEMMHDGLIYIIVSRINIDKRREMLILKNGNLEYHTGSSISSSQETRRVVLCNGHLFSYWYKWLIIVIGLEVLTAVVMKSSFFLHMTPCQLLTDYTALCPRR
jgi:hypothetical protein